MRLKDGIMVWYLVGGYTISAVFEGCSRGYLQPPPASLVPHGYKRLTVFGKRKACDGCKGESNDADAEAAARQT